MRWFTLILVCAVLTRATSEPDPKKYKIEDADKDKKTSTILTVEEKNFLREVEEKFGVKSQVPVEIINNATETKSIPKNSTEKTPLPAVIAIEIVNDTESASKGKRTIDANLGYGYRTNEGYTYTYFGKPKQEEGKFMIYPYSQQDSSTEYNGHSAEYSQQSSGKYSQASSVEIQPSQAFELVSVRDEHYDDNSKSVGSSPGYPKEPSTTFPSTLYTTYNGEGLSGLSGHFPRLMSNYFVDPKQLLTNPQYQNIGLNQDHLSTNGLDQNKPVVPVLVLRIPSSYLKNPTAELYANLPNNYPLSHYLNNVNLQGLVNQYFKKNGYDVAPQVMTHQNPQLSTSMTPTVSSTYNSEPQQYSNPHVQPSYTQSDYSGVQYSGVKPVMAKYPSSLSGQKYYSSRIQSQYRRPVQQPKYEYRYHHYVPHTPAHTQAYYGQSFHKDPQVSYEQQSELAALAKPSGDTSPNTEYESPQYSPNHDSKIISVEYDSNTPSHSSHQAENTYIETPQYDISKESQEAYNTQESLSHDYSSQSLSDYSSQLAGYYAQKQIESTETVNTYPSPTRNTERDQQTYSEVSATQGYDYPKPREESVSNSYVIPETYASKDHTIATVLPFTYKQPKRPNTATVQTVSYVTPVPSSKYQSRYRIMVPQTVLKSQDEKVTYVNSVPMHYTKIGYYNQDYNSEENSKYSVGNYYSSPTNKHKPVSYTRNYHNYPKRMARPDSKAEGSMISSQSKKSSDKKKSS